MTGIIESGRWWQGVAALADETVVRGWAANSVYAHRTRGGQTVPRTAGGRLHLTSRRVVFTPHIVAAAFGADPWSYYLRDILSVQGVPATRHDRRDGSWRARLKITLRDDREELLVINHVERVAAELADHVAQAQP